MGTARAVDHPEAVSALAEELAGGGVVAMTGAGISTDSGIPDFRGPQGVWTTRPEAQRLFTLDAYVADPQVRVQAWRGRRDHPAWTAEPNEGHRALVALEAQGRLHLLLTQNVDGLHQQAGSRPDRVVELHGTLREVECLSCRRRTPMREELARVEAGDPDPACRVCGGLLKSATVSFGQALDPAVLGRAVASAEAARCFLVVGSSLTVQPAAGLCRRAVGAGARLVVLNAEPTPYDGLAHLLLRAPIGAVLPAAVAQLGETGSHG